MAFGVIRQNDCMVMKRIVTLLVLLVAVTAHASSVWVAVKNTAVRKDASNLSPVITRLKYQDELELLSESGDWWQVSFEGKEGWVHKSALSKSLEQAAGSGQKSSGASIFDVLRGRSSGSQSKHSSSKRRGGDADDITLAGKGFNEDVEGEFKSRGASELNYAAVDAMENRKVPPFDFQKFADDGDLDYSIEVEEKKQEEKSWGGFSLPGGLF